MNREEIKDARAALTAVGDQLDATGRGRLMKTPRGALDGVARDLGIGHPEYSLKADLVNRILKRLEA